VELHARRVFYGYLYKARGTPRIRLSRISADMGGLYDGSILAGTTAWWNLWLARRPGLERLGYFCRYDKETTLRLAESINPENHDLLAVLGAEHAPGNRKLGMAAIALAYAFARTFMAGTNYEEGREELFVRGGLVTPEHFENLSHRYGIEADYYLWEQSPGWWAEQEQWFNLGFAVRAIRWAYDDQIKRWEKGEGRKLGSGVGWGMNEDIGLLVSFSERLFEQGARFYEAEA
jgi:hypothetical protein